jgi:butyrate kinase
MMTFRILAINPGSTSTKIALFEDETEIFNETIVHPWEEMKDFRHIIEEEPARERAILKLLDEKGIALGSLDATVGRGGYMKTLTCGTYEACEEMLGDLRAAVKEHASTLGVLLAESIARKAGVKAYTVNPVIVDEALPIAKISGMKEIERETIMHCLSHKEIGRRMAEKLGKRYDECNFIICHMGGGTSVAGHQKGLAIDATASTRGEGPFTGARCGGVHPGQLADMCFSGEYTYDEMNVKLMKTGGLVSYLGTDDGREVERRIGEGDEYAALIYEAMAYQTAREIGAQAAVMHGDVDAICVTGGFARSELLMSWIRERVEFIAPMHVFPGECEMEALNMGVLLVLRGEERAKPY